MERKGFTLAEVLITLGIVGIVAAYTIPLLINSYQNQVYVYQLKSSFSTIQQFIKQYLADQGTTELRNTPLYDGTNWLSNAKQSQVDSIVRQYFKVVKACKAYPNSPRDTSCDMVEKYLGLASTSTLGNGAYNFCTVDGVCFFMSLQTSCNPDYSKIGNMKANCGSVSIDTNGANLPNTYGRDAWASFAIGHDGTLFPLTGIEFAKYQEGINWETGTAYWQSPMVAPGFCGTLGSSNLTNVRGDSCAARVMENGWVMDY